jgi:hypothetical protein
MDKNMYIDIYTDKPLKYCEHCGAAHDTAISWELKCPNNKRHNFVLGHTLTDKELAEKAKIVK